MAFDLAKFNSQVYTAMTEVADQQVNAFNEQGNDALMLVPSSKNMGDFTIEASFKLIAGLVRRRDVNNGTTAVTAKRLEQLKKASVKVAAGTPPITFEPAQYRWILESPERAAIMIGEQLATAMVQDQLNAAIRSLVAAMLGNSDVNNDISAATVKTASIASLTDTAAKFGDRMASIRAWVVHSKVMNDIWQNAIANAGQLFRFGDVAIMTDQFGRRFIVTDSPALSVTSGSGSTAATSYYTLGLAEQAALVEPNNDFDATMVDSTGKENIQRTYQAEWSFNVGLLGYGWDTAATSASCPNDTALGTSANWKKTATSNKDTAGVILKSS